MSVTKNVGENPNQCAIDRALIPEGSQVAFRGQLLKKSNAPNIVVGSSRVGKIRRESLEDKALVNFTLPDFGPDSYLGLVRFLTKFPHVKSVFLGSEFYAFGDQNFFYRLLDRTYFYAEKFGLQKIFINVFLYWYELRGSQLFPTPVMKIYNLITEYLSLPATERSLRLLIKKYRVSKVVVIDLPERSLVPSKCLISSTETINNDGAWDPIDGSEYNRGDLLGEGTVPDFSEYDPNLFDGRDQSSHWHLFVGFKRLSVVKMAILEKTLSEFSRRKIKVVGFTSPFPDKLLGLWQQMGFIKNMKEFENEAAEIYGKYGFVYLPPQKSSEIGCRDLNDYDDVWHAGTQCMEKTMENIKNRMKQGNAL